MSSIFSGLNILTRAIYAQQTALNTVGHNVANANTDGYSRQSVNMVTSNPETIYGGAGQMQVGTGVDVQSITRARDLFVDRQIWKEGSTQGYSTVMQDSLGKIEDVFHEPSDSGIQSMITKFWNSWQSLSTSASDDTVRATVREQGYALVDALKHADTQLRALSDDVNNTLQSKVQEINQITTELVSLNKQITRIEVGGVDNANDLRDRRDSLIDQLSQLSNINVNEDQDGNYIVQISGNTIVDGQSNTQLALQSAADPDYNYEIQNVVIKGTSTKVNFTSGEMKALLDTRDSDTTGVVAYLNDIDKISQFLLTDFNEAHRAGYGEDNQNGRNFFGDPSVTDFSTATRPAGGWIQALNVNSDLYDPQHGLEKIAAKTLAQITQSNSQGGRLQFGGAYDNVARTNTVVVRVNTFDPTTHAATAAEVSTDGGTTFSAATVSAAGVITLPYGLTATITANAANAANDTYTFTLPPQGNAAGDNAVLMGARLKTDTSTTLGNTSLDAYYNTVIGGLGIQGDSMKRIYDNQTVLMDQLQNWRESTAGVNMDEEMTNMIKFQKGYNAAARVITTMDEMLDKLINGMGVAGR